MPALPARVVVALLIGGLVGAYAWAYTHRAHPRAFGGSDLSIQWAAARALLAGADPYAAVGPRRPFPFVAPLAYPAPSLVLLAPLTRLSQFAADAVFAGGGAAALAFALTRRTWLPLLALLSWPFLYATMGVQWAPWLAAATAPAFAWFVVGKPTLGLAIAAYRPSRAWCAVAGAGALLAAAVAWTHDPAWVTHWRAALAEPTATRLGGASVAGLYLAPITRPGGVLVLAALLRWRRPEARLLVALACVPQTMVGYELVPLLALVPATLTEGLLLAVLSWIFFLAMVAGVPYATSHAAFLAGGTWSVWLLFLPATLLVLTRPNVGWCPAWPRLRPVPLTRAT